MADEKGTQKPKERVKYKFGQNDIDLANYIHNLGTNVQSYLNSKNWNEGQKQEFMNAYDKYLTGLQDQLANNTNRFTTDDFGSIIDSTGALSNTDNDDIDPVGSEYYYDNKGNRITTDDFNLLKKRKQKNYNTFSANREVATYFNTIGNALKGMETPKEKVQDAFDLSKHGFLADWTTANNPAGGDFNLDPYLEKDAIDETTGKRGTSNRAAYLKEQIENYINNIGEYDFSSSPFKNRDTYISRLRAAAQNLENGYDSEDVIALNQAGIRNEFLSKFFATGATTENLGTEAQQAAQYVEQQQRKEEEQRVIDQANRLRAMSELNQYIKDNPFKPKDSGFLDGGDYDAELVLQDIERNYSDIEGDDNKVKAWINFGQLLEDLRNPVIDGGRFGVMTREETMEKMKALRRNIAQKLKFAAREGYMKSYGNDEYIIPGSEDYNNYSVMTYNPNTGEYKDQSIILNEKLREAMAYDWYKKNQAVSSNKNGGVLSYLQEGGFMKRAREARQQRKQQEQPQQKVQQKQEDNRTKEQKEAGQRKISDGLSGTDIARLAAIGMDLTSAISSFVPGAGTAVSGITGIGSTLTTLGADIAEDGFQWSDLGNAGVGLGMDIVGMIPGFGTAGKASKIGKQLVKFAPLVLGALQAQNALSEPSRESWQKIIDGKFKDLTVDDLRNLASGVTAFTSLSNQAGIRMKNSAMKSATKTGDKTIESKTGEMVRITPEKLEELRKAKSLKDQNAILQSIPGNEGKELASKVRGNFNITRLWDNNPRIADHYDWSRLRGTAFDNSNSLLSDAQIFQSVRQSNLGNINWHLRNPYSKLLDRSKKTSKNNKTTQEPQSRFDRLRQLSSQTGKLTQKEINIINQQRAKQNLPALTQKEIDALNARRAYRKEQNDLIAETFHGVFPTHYWSKKLGLSGMVDNARYIQKRETQKQVRTAQKELAETTRQQRLAVPTGQGEIVSPDANQARFIMGFSRAIPTINPSRPPISNPSAIIPKQQVRIEQPQQSPFNYDRIREGLARAERERLGRDIGEQRLQRAIEANPERSARLQSEEAYRNVRQAFNLYGAPQYKRPLTGAAYKAKQDMYNRLFNQRRYDVIEAFRNRELPHRQSKKKKKTSRDDRRTVKREDGGTLDLVRVRKFQNAGKFPEWYSKLYKFQNLTGWNNSLNQSLAGPSITNENAGHYKSFFSNINPTIAYGLPRAMYADRMNRRITDLAKESVVPLLKDPFEVHRYTRSDLDAEMQGERDYANLRRLASRPITSDGSLQAATQLQAEVQGQEARTAGKEKSNQVQRQYDELAWQQEKENAANRHETAMFNRAQLWNSDKVKRVFEQAYLSKKYNVWDVLGQQLEYDARTKQKENKALADNFARFDIHNAISYAPNDYGANLTPDELTVWNKVLSGTNPSSLSSQEFNSYKLAAQKVSRVGTEQLRQYYNIPNTRWSRKTPRKTPSTPWSPTISKAVSAKNGAKIAVAGIKAKTADAERFQKQIKECIDRNEKAIDRLSKSLYGLIKASMIK